VTSQELETRPTGELEELWKYAKALATAGTLPKAYRNSPGDILLAMEYGKALNLPSVATVMQSVHVIDGRPSMSAELMAALCRRAGHQVRIAGDSSQGTCVIVRRDDPEFAYRVTFTLEDARQAKLIPAKAGSGWANYPKAMLIARAISACCRQACSDVLAGVAYTQEELTQGAVVDTTDLGIGRTVDATLDVVAPEAPTAPPEPAQERPAPRPVAEDNREAWTDSWMAALDDAKRRQDLSDITDLANRAGDAGQDYLVDTARAAWLDVQGQLADA
jgi:hypothetical protein